MSSENSDSKMAFYRWTNQETISFVQDQSINQSMATVLTELTVLTSGKTKYEC